MLLMLNQWLQIKINAEEQESYEIRRLEDNLVCLHAYNSRFLCLYAA